MISIVISHFATHGGFHFEAQTLSIPRFWWYFIEMGGYFGVNVFVLISGYFLINDRSGLFNYKRILKFWGQVVFYSLAIYVIFGVAGVSEFSWKETIGTLCPITTNRWWFASTYFELYLLHPFLNMFLRRMDKGIFQKFLVLLIIIWCIVPTLTPEDYQVNPLVRPFLWQTVFKNASYQDSALIIPYSIAVVLLVYSVCTIIDLIRKATVENVYMAAVNTYADTWVKPFEAVIGAVKRFVFGNE